MLLDALPQEYADLEEMGLLVLRDGQPDIMETIAHLEKMAGQYVPSGTIPTMSFRWRIAG